MGSDGAEQHEQIIGGNGEVNVGHGRACPTTEMLSAEKWFLHGKEKGK